MPVRRQRHQVSRQGLGGLQSGLVQGFGQGVHLDALVKHQPHQPGQRRVVDLVLGEHLCKQGAHPLADRARGVDQRGRIGKAQGTRQPRLHLRVTGEAMGLLVGLHLDGVFQPPQIGIVGVELPRALGVEQPLIAQQRQGRPKLRRAQTGVLSAAHQLKALDDEFDLTNAAGPELDVVIQPLAQHFIFNQPLQFAQAVDGIEVEIAPVDERREAGQQPASGLQVAGDGPRLDQGVALPLAAVDLVVVLHRRKAGGGGAGAAEGSQHPVDTVDKPVGRALGQQAGEALHHLGEKAAGIQRARAVGLALGGKGEDQVDVAGKIELAPAELAHAENHRLNALPALIDRPAVHLSHRLLGHRQGQRARRFGQVAEPMQGGVEVIQSFEITHRQAHALAQHVFAQVAHGCGFIAGAWLGPAHAGLGQRCIGKPGGP